ncbi:uncharacterized protein [Nicotiana tomentosiformis]|uniref:uncharacterized protein n=1 Tax=Nicotiana tomentosiformis TaxID=4098 RepID=UPI00388C7307
MILLGLKNAGATYMRSMMTIFHDTIHKEIEVYVDDVIIKSKRSSDHIADLKKLFDWLRKYNLKLNPAKKVVRFHRQSPRMQRKDFAMSRTEECQKAFDKIKEYLSKQPVLVPPEPGRPLLLYLSVVLGEWATKNTIILLYFHCVQELIKRFTKIEFKHVPRIQNEFVDALATLSSIIQHPDNNFIDPIPIGIHKQPTYCAHVEEEIDGNPWFHDIKEYLEKGEYPENTTYTQKCTLRRLASHFFQSGGILYIGTPDLGLLRCVNAKEASRLLEEIHVETCGPHINGLFMTKKILRAGYLWMTMETYCIKYVQKCHQCQIHAAIIRVPPNELNATSSPCPFSAWGMDVIGPIEPATLNGHRFILVAIDYFTKWVEVASYKAVTKKVVTNFVRTSSFVDLEYLSQSLLTMLPISTT